MLKSLGAEALYRRCDLKELNFETTDDLERLSGIVGQDRASEAVRFGIGIRRDGFNIYALGPEGTDKRQLVCHFLEERAANEPPPDDLCYVNNFEEAHKPRALRLPPGKGRQLADDMERCLDHVRTALSGAFESEEYQTRRESIQEEAGQVQQEAVEELQQKSRERGLTLLRTPSGFVFAPTKDGDVIPPDEMEKLSDEERKRLESQVEELQEEMQQILRQAPRLKRQAGERVRELDQTVARDTVRDLLQELREKYADLEPVLTHLEAVEKDLVKNARRLAGGRDGPQQQLMAAMTGGAAPPAEDDGEFRRYSVNVLVDHGESEHAPIVYEDNPTYQNLVGRIEYQPRMGALVTDFNLMKPGALHRANGGYLILDARRLLLQPFAWEALKRALQSGELRIESPHELVGLVSTVSLEPETVSFDAKLVLLGSRLLYYLLGAYEPDFRGLFKVEADFDEDMDRSPDNESLHARLIASLVRKAELRPFQRSAVARVIEQSARMTGDAEKLSVQTRKLLDLLREADYWAATVGAEVVGAEHVQSAIDQSIYRSNRLKERVQEGILRDTIYIDTEGSRVGQVNGLVVTQLGDYAFGRPGRITARVRLGKGEVVDIEREVELSGPIHSKGVLILSGFLGARYAMERPLSLAASLVFEQSYAGVEGDSASSAELYALLSAIGELPIKQSIAVTGSVNQHGRVQPIGAVNEKIEGFFDICNARGLTGEQGVLIPASNVKHLMLRRDVVDAVSEKRFHVWAIETVDQGMEILTALPMGERDEQGNYPENSVNHRVEQRLAELAEHRKTFSHIERGESE
ncbi:MAG: ATP-binding protein [Gemmatimonadales bacterium]|jgi:lon-related putative ATP-dependent protease